MERGRAWRRGQAERVFQNRHAYTRRIYGGAYTWRRWSENRPWFIYTRRNSVSETVEVEVYTNDQMEYYLELKTKMLMNNPVNCQCYMCKSGRANGYGNSQSVLSYKEGLAMNDATTEIMRAIEDVQPINYTFRSRKWRRHG